MNDPVREGEGSYKRKGSDPVKKRELSDPVREGKDPIGEGKGPYKGGWIL